jgi:hypothetical protein
LFVVLAIVGCASATSDPGDPVASESDGLKVKSGCPKKEPSFGDACTDVRLVCDYRSKTCASGASSLACVCVAGSMCTRMEWEGGCTP